MTADTPLSRSTAFYQPGTIDPDAWFRVAATDYHALLDRLDFDAGLAGVARVLDVGCGLGKFPALLAERLGAGAGAPVTVDFLDPSDHCLAEYPNALSGRLRPGTAHHATMETADAGRLAPVDLVWSVHSIYGWAAASLGRSLARFRATAPDGDWLIYVAGAPSFYHRFYDAYRAAVAPDTPGYITAEQVLAALGDTPHRVIEVPVEHTLPADDEELMAAYFQQLSFDKTRSLARFLAVPAIAELVAKAKQDGVFRFHQANRLIGSPAILDRLSR